MKKNIAIIGAGFAGLACCFHLLKKNFNVTVFFSENNASAISAGLLHPFTGAKSRYNWKGEEGLQAARILLTQAENALGRSITTNNGVLRVALSDQQKIDFNDAADRYADIEKLNAINIQNIHPFLPKSTGILIKSGMSVFSNLYMEGLKKICIQMEAVFIQRKIHQLIELDAFDFIIVASGADTTEIAELQHLPIKLLKGQILKLKWPEGADPLPMPITSGVYVVMSEDKKSFFAGATFERTFAMRAPDISIAKEYILPKVQSLLPGLKEHVVLDCKSGIRAATMNHRPFVKQVSPKVFVFTGLGSKGLLYHALFAKQLADTIEHP